MKSIQWISLWTFILAFGAGGFSQARVFSVKDERLAAYLRAAYVPTSFDNTLISGSHGTGSTLDVRTPYNLGAELGFVYSVGRLSYRFGLEFIRLPDKKDQGGVDAAGTALYSVSTEASAVAPKLGVDINLKSWNVSKFYAGVAVGYASLVALNSYTMTAAGTAQYPGVTDFSEDLRSGAPLYEALLGFETLFNDSTTIAIEAVYRNLKFTDAKFNKDVKNFKGNFVKGDAALNDDGSPRALTLNQFYIGVNGRFWLY